MTSWQTTNYITLSRLSPDALNRPIQNISFFLSLSVSAQNKTLLKFNPMNVHEFIGTCNIITYKYLKT